MRKLTLLLCALLAGISLAVAQTSISGTVLSAENDEPVIGASILVKGANASTITDTDGKFTIKIPAGASRTLVISYIGMEKQEVFARNGMVVKLNSADHTLDDVVVVGYQTIRKEAKTGSIATVDGDDLASIPETSVDKMLSGKMAGVSVSSSNGQPGSVATIRVRGTSSIGAGNNPLYVVDGIPVESGDVGGLSNSMNAIALINPSDIASVTVLNRGNPRLPPVPATVCPRLPMTMTSAWPTSKSMCNINAMPVSMPGIIPMIPRRSIIFRRLWPADARPTG